MLRPKVTVRTSKFSSWNMRRVSAMAALRIVSLLFKGDFVSRGEQALVVFCKADAEASVGADVLQVDWSWLSAKGDGKVEFGDEADAGGGLLTEVDEVPARVQRRGGEGADDGGVGFSGRSEDVAIGGLATSRRTRGTGSW